MNLFKYNYILTAAFVAWALAQIIKTTINTILTKKFKAERLLGSGGMPSSHSSLVLAALVAIGRVEGITSSIFALAFILAAITVYDAMGVRRAAGDHAKFINIFLLDRIANKQDGESDYKDEKDKEKEKENFPYKKFKEYIGHTPLEVFFGSLLGVIVALVLPVS